MLQNSAAMSQNLRARFRPFGSLVTIPLKNAKAAKRTTWQP
jgi:hypothetical protein